MRWSANTVLGASTLGAALTGVVLSGCSSLPPAQVHAAAIREQASTVMLHGASLQLHLSAPVSVPDAPVLVLYASGDGGWFGAAVDMFRQIADGGYFAAGFSARAFLHIERPRGMLVTAAQLSAEYDKIIGEAERALGLDPATPVVLSGWSRGASFSVLVASEPPPGRPVLGIVAIGLPPGEDLSVNDADDDSDEGQMPLAGGRWPFDTYETIARLSTTPCTVIQATHDRYLSAALARDRFGPDTVLHRLVAIDAKNHRFSGGKAPFDAALLEAIGWASTIGP